MRNFPSYFMHAVILAGGFGTRLKPITDYVPKPMIPIDDVPILEWQIRYLKRYKVTDITICTRYKAEHIENFLDAKDNFGIKIRLAIEKTPLGTAGAIKNASRHIKGKSFLVLNGDIITDIDLDVMRETQNTIAGVELRTQFGTLDVAGDKIVSFKEKKPIQGVWINAGIYHLRTDILKELPAKGDIEKTTFPKLAKQGKLTITKFADAQWFSIDSHKDITECSKVIKTIIT